MNLIAADIGGTKSWLAWLTSTADGGSQVSFEQRYKSRDFTEVTALIRQFLADANALRQPITGITLALPGPLQNGTVSLTNLGWRVDQGELKQQFAPAQVCFINDFKASVNGIPSLNQDDILTLNPGRPDDQGLRLVTGAGTGLGLAWIPAGGDFTDICASEGGHIDFAPMDDSQDELLAFLRARHGHVSYERILSGDGLVQLYRFFGLRETTPHDNRLDSVPDKAAEINRLAGIQDSVACQAVNLFIRVYAQWIGNLALLYRPGGGLFITGGMAAKMAAWIQTGDFMTYSRNKGRMSRLVDQTPVYLVINERLGLQGAITTALAHANKTVRKSA